LLSRRYKDKMAMRVVQTFEASQSSTGARKTNSL
jgi:hypothetical protein